MIDTIARGLAIQAKIAATTGLPTTLTGQGLNARLNRIMRRASAAQLSNPRNAGLLATAPTFTDVGASAPTQTTNNYPITSSNYGVWHVTGGQMQAAGANLIYNDTVSPGVFGTNMSRWEVMMDARYLALQLRGASKSYRLIVNGQFVSTSASIVTSASKDWWLVDFSTRAMRRIAIDVSVDGAVFAGAVEATGKLFPVDLSDAVHAVFVGDSYEGGTGPTLAADAPALVLGDWLGCYMHSSGVGGTGWVNNGGSGKYTFGQRLGPSTDDVALSPYPPDIIFLKASVNDRTYTATTITPATLAGLQSARSRHPGIPIVVFGCAGASYVSTVTANEAAVQAAVVQFGDPLCAFAPVSSDPGGAWVTGSGTIASPVNNGNSDWATVSDGTHPTDEGAAYLGRRYAMAGLAALKSLYPGA